MTTTRPIIRIFSVLAMTGVLTVLLAACGKSAAPVPTMAPPTAVPATVLPAATGASPAAGELTVGQLADRIAAAWPSVKDYRSTTTSSNTMPASPFAASPVAVTSPVSGVADIVTLEEVVLPDQRHLTQFQNGALTAEILVVSGTMYVRGPALTTGTPVANPDQWTQVDPARLIPGSELALLYAQLSAPITPIYSGLSDAERSRVAHPVGTITKGGRVCDAYQTVDTTMTGERIDITIALDSAGLPCSIETGVGTSETLTVFEFNTGITIATPIP